MSLPAATIHHLHDFDRAHVGAVLMPWLLFLIGVLVFWSVATGWGCTAPRSML